MSERLTWDEIKKRYPDEFVAMTDPEHDESASLCGGTVVAHGKNKHELLHYLKTLGAKHTACLWTGEVHARVRHLVRRVVNE
jgi:hypothetical protein